MKVVMEKIGHYNVKSVEALKAIDSALGDTLLPGEFPVFTLGLLDKQLTVKAYRATELISHEEDEPGENEMLDGEINAANPEEYDDSGEEEEILEDEGEDEE